MVASSLGAMSHSTPVMPGDESLVMPFIVPSPLGATSHSTPAMPGDESLVMLFMIILPLRTLFTVFYILVVSLLTCRVLCYMHGHVHVYNFMLIMCVFNLQ